MTIQKSEDTIYGELCMFMALGRAHRDDDGVSEMMWTFLSAHYKTIAVEQVTFNPLPLKNYHGVICNEIMVAMLIFLKSILKYAQEIYVVVVTSGNLLFWPTRSRRIYMSSQVFESHGIQSMLTSLQTFYPHWKRIRDALHPLKRQSFDSATRSTQ